MMHANPPKRGIVSTAPAPGGINLKLECGHKVYCAGKKPSDFCTFEDGLDTYDTHCCCTGPCYKFRKPGHA